MRKEDERKPIGVWVISNNLAVELLDIEHGIDDIAIIREPDGTISRHEIQYASYDGEEDEGTTYIQPYEDGMMLYFDECIRTHPDHVAAMQRL